MEEPVAEAPSVAPSPSPTPIAENKKISDKPDDGPRKNLNYVEYLMAMKRVHRRRSMRASLLPEMRPPRERHREDKDLNNIGIDSAQGKWRSVQEADRVSTIASMVPDEIIYNYYDHGIRAYETALMFVDVSGFTDLCEKYTKAGRGGPSRLSQVLNSYIGAMVQEILTYNGDVLKFSGDAFISMWKKTGRHSMHNCVHTAIDCALVIQKNYGKYVTDVGVVLKVKISISAGVSYFSIIGGGDSSQTSFVIVGQPVWDVKKAEYLCKAGDVLTSASAWTYINESWYCTQPCDDGHVKVLGVGATWKRVKMLSSFLTLPEDSSQVSDQLKSRISSSDGQTKSDFREFSLRPAVVTAMRSTWWPGLRSYMLAPVLRAVENNEPMDFLTEVRRVVVVFLNIITKTVTPDVLINVVDRAFKCVSSVTANSGGLVNKVSMFDKDMMFLVVFGLRGLKHEDEAQKALQCAFQLKTSLDDDHIKGVSIGVTSGTTYCGVCGHTLRREYTVIGPAVNKAARLMMAYPDKVTCDKETFLRSKLDQEYFKLLEGKVLKGIAKPGPVYEFNKLLAWHERQNVYRHPILGRKEEMRKFKTTLENAIQQRHMNFTRYRDHKFAIVFSGPRLIGKSRLMDECLNVTPEYIRVEKVILTEETKVPYGLFRLIVARTLTGGKARTSRENCENRIRYSFDLASASPVQIFALNVIFNTRFPLPEHFKYTGDLLDDYTVKHMLQAICKANYTNLWILAVEAAQYTDDESWRILLLLLETKTTFVVMTITLGHKLTPLAMKCLENNMIVKVDLQGIDRWYHAALACQLLDVQAIPPDLEKVIESASAGMPGWIQNFVISLVQRGALTVVTVPRSEAHASGAIMPSPSLLQKPENALSQDDFRTHSYLSIYSLVSGGDSSFNVSEGDIVQMAVLGENYTFDDLTVDMAMDVTILKTYDSLTPFEKMLLKCASVLGDVFSRRMLMHLLQSDSSRDVAQAVAKLFAIRVLECEGGDFTRDTSLVLIHPAPAMPGAKPPYCACLGTRQPPNSRDLPMYAFCGYMRFRHSLFRTTTYELLTENQKVELHARALMFLERYTRRCYICGSGCFVKLLGLRCDDGLLDESPELKRTREQICAISAETKVPGEINPTSSFMQDNVTELKMTMGENLASYELLENEGTLVNRFLGTKSSRASVLMYDKFRKDKRVRSFSSLDLDSCECLAILLFVYCQIIDHCRGAGEDDKLYEAYLEYANLCIVNLNIPQAVRLLYEVEKFIQQRSFYKMGVREDWVMNYQLARICSMRGVCMLESGDLSEARTQLLVAMKLYGIPFPTNKNAVKLANMRASVQQWLTLSVAPNFYIASDQGLAGYFFEDIARAFVYLFLLFDEAKEVEHSALAAKLSLNYALRTNANFTLLCAAYGSLISSYRQKQNFSMCLKFEKRAMDVCHRKRGILDVIEVQALCYLYTNIFLFYVEYGKKMESLEFGLSVMHMMTNLIDLSTRHKLIIWMLKLLLSDLRIHDMVAIMREFFYTTDYYDLSSETWYYFYSMLIFLNTGYCVETYSTCEKFYIKKGDAILRSKTPEAAWNFFVSMWLMTIRIGAWEKSILWEDKIKQVMSIKFEKHEFNFMILGRLLEGLLVTLVKEVNLTSIYSRELWMNNWNIKKIIVLEKSINMFFKDMNRACKLIPLHRPRYYLLLAYYNFIRGKRMKAYGYLNKSHEIAKQMSHEGMIIWCEHTKNHWKGTLNPQHVNYWVEHAEEDNLLDYRDFDSEKKLFIPFTLPLPRELETI